VEVQPRARSYALSNPTALSDETRPEARGGLITALKRGAELADDAGIRGELSQASSCPQGLDPTEQFKHFLFGPTLGLFGDKQFRSEVFRSR
jgi:hypothetical protein